jgi:hypothetical protein
MSEHIFNLDLDYNFPKFNLQNNLYLLENMLGNEFEIKYTLHNKLFSFKVNLIKKLLPNNTKFYRLKYIDDNNIYTRLIPLMIDFIDIITNKLNNNSYINDIHKINGISGTEFLLIALRINKILGVEKTNLIDTATIKINKIDCDLSFIKLLQNNKTFYMKFGFDFEISLTQMPFIRYENLFDLKQKVFNIIQNIKKIKIENIKNEYIETKKILNIININNMNKFNIKIDNFSTPIELNEIFLENPTSYINSIFIECDEILNLINKYTFTYLFELFIELFNKNSVDYLILQKYFIENKRTKIIFEDTIIKRDYIFDISMLLLLRNSYYYSYNF